jgi:hypothetical protein
MGTSEEARRQRMGHARCPRIPGEVNSRVVAARVRANASDELYNLQKRLYYHVRITVDPGRVPLGDHTLLTHVTA